LRGKLWISVDPGVTGTGIAIWKGSKLKESYAIAPRGKTWKDKLEDLVFRFGDETDLPGFSALVYEMPFIDFQSSERSMISASKQDVVKLCIGAGMLAGAFLSWAPNAHIYPIPVQIWKGQVPKLIHQKRLQKRFHRLGLKPSTNTTHEADAIGLGLFVLYGEKADDHAR
jgi:hypothetical protein